MKRNLNPFNEYIGTIEDIPIEVRQSFLKHLPRDIRTIMIDNILGWDADNDYSINNDALCTHLFLFSDNYKRFCWRKDNIMSSWDCYLSGYSAEIPIPRRPSWTVRIFFDYGHNGVETDLLKYKNGKLRIITKSGFMTGTKGIKWSTREVFEWSAYRDGYDKVAALHPSMDISKAKWKNNKGVIINKNPGLPIRLPNE